MKRRITVRAQDRNWDADEVLLVTKRILIIDDDEAVRFAFQLALEDLPYQVDEAADGESGARIATTEPDLLIYIVTAFHREFLDDLVTVRGEGLTFELLRKPVERDQIIEIVTSALPC
jgi:CheY-like chemotaxis protein